MRRAVVGPALLPPRLVSPRPVSRPIVRIVVVLFLSVVSLGGWGVRAAGMGREVMCAHDAASTADMPAHMDMSRDAGMDVASPPEGVAAATSADAAGTPCCASDQVRPEAPPTPCSTHHGAMPCGFAQLCPTTSALWPAASATPATLMLAQGTPAPTLALRVVGPAIAPDVPPPRGRSPFRS